jgi:HSP90 family molecular chaperone
VLIKKDTKNVILPSFLRFVKGVVDCEDIPLNISRENFQDSALMAKLRAYITKRVIKTLKEEAEKNPDAYNTWYNEFEVFIK